MNPHSFQLDRLRAGLRPFRLHWFPRLRSTNDHAAVLRRRGDLYAPAIVLTGHQLAGRGRGSNTWWSGQGSLTVTFVLPIDEQTPPHQLPLLAGLAVRSAAAELTGNGAIQLKWPNDLLFEDRKLAGLLCERVERVDLVGLGLNVNVDARNVPRALRDRVTSLSQIARRTIDMTSALALVASHLRARRTEGAPRAFAAALREYDAHHALVGRSVQIVGANAVPLSGRVEGLDAMGRLLLRSQRKLHHIIAGQVVMGR